MTPLKVAKEECANCDSVGNCAGIGIADNLSCYMFRQPGKCWLAPDENGQIKQCQYFDQCVTPLAQARLREAQTSEQRANARRLADGVRDYEARLQVKPVSAKFRCASEGCRRTVLRPARLCHKHSENGS